LQLSSVEYVESLQQVGKKPKPTSKANTKVVSDFDFTDCLILTHHLQRFLVMWSNHTVCLLLQNAPKTKPPSQASQVRTQSRDRARAKEQEKKKTNKLAGDANTKSSKANKTNE
jgi:hypothetical protein